jgi:uncharacterized protein YraI
MMLALRGKRNSLIVVLAVIALVLSACATPTPAPTQDVALIQTQAAQTIVADLTANAPPPPTQAPPPTAAPTQAVPTQAPPPGPTPDPSVPVAVVPTPASGEPSAVANYNTHIYSGPGQDYVVYGSFLGGAAARVVGKNDAGTWWAISVPVAPNGTGWVDAGWVTATGADSVPVLPTPPVPPTVELVPPGAGDPQATALVNVYVRSGPATNFPAYGIAPVGTTGRVIGKSEDAQWWVVRVNPQNIGAGYAWVMAQYTQASNTAGVQTVKTPSSSVQEVPPPPPADGPTATAVEYVNVRSGPGTNYPVLVVAPPGASGEVSGKSEDGGWWQVKLSTQYAADGLGWVSASYVTTQNTDSIPVAEAPPAPPVVETTPPPATTTGCSVVSQTPADGTAIGLGAPFDTTWVLQNNGSNRWDQGEYDIMFVGAANNVYLHTGADRYDLTTTVQPGSTYNFTVPMLAPFGPGTFGELWQVVLGNQAVCEFYVYITVQ